MAFILFARSARSLFLAFCFCLVDLPRWISCNIIMIAINVTRQQAMPADVRTGIVCKQLLCVLCTVPCIFIFIDEHFYVENSPLEYHAPAPKEPANPAAHSEFCVNSHHGDLSMLNSSQFSWINQKRTAGGCVCVCARAGWGLRMGYITIIRK